MLEKLFCRTNYYKKHYRRAGVLRSVLYGSPIRTAVFGSTQIMYAVDFSAFSSFAGVNFALPVQPFKYDGLILKKVLEQMPPDGNVIFGICPFSFLLTDFSAQQKETELFKRYQFLLSPDELEVEFDPEQVARKCFFEWKHFFRLFNRKEPQTVSSLATNEEFHQNAIRRMMQWQRAFMTPPEYDGLLKPESIGINCSILREMISLAASCRQHVYLLLPPVSEELFREISPQRLKKYLYEPLEKAVSGCRVKVLDFITDARLVRHEMFLDSLLLNEKGQKALSQFIAEELTNKSESDCTKCTK